jgi:hypothetical protein
MSFQSLLNKNMTVYTVSVTKNQIGEDVEVETESITQKCRLHRRSGAETVYMDNVATKIDIIVYTTYVTGFEEWDYVVIDSKKYRIYSHNVCMDQFNNHHLELICYAIDRK